DARRLLRLAGAALAGDDGATVREAAALLEQLLLQDVVETPDGAGGVKAAIKAGTAPARIPSATDPEQRHGRKSQSKRFTGHKASVAVDVESQLILDADVLPGSAGDASEALAQVERVEATTGQTVAQSMGDCAYGGGEARQAFAEAGRELVAKVPQESDNQGRFPKRAFVIDLEQETVTCPGGQTTARFTAEKDGGKTFHFGAVCQDCPLRAHCTTAAGGRTVQVHAQEALLQAARAAQATPEGRAVRGAFSTPWAAGTPGRPPFCAGCCARIDLLLLASSVPQMLVFGPTSSGRRLDGDRGTSRAGPAQHLCLREAEPALSAVRGI